MTPATAWTASRSGEEAEAACPAAVRTGPLTAYFALAKGRLVLAILAVVAATFLAAGGPLGWRLVAVLVGTAATAGAAGALNQWWEAPFDAQMVRTRGRPIPTGRIGSREALAFAAGLFTLGAVVLQVGAGAARPCWRRPARPSTCWPTPRSAPLAPEPGPGRPVGRAARPDRLDRGGGDAQRRGAAAVRRPAGLAGAPHPGDRLALPRRLRARRLPDALALDPTGRATGRVATAGAVLTAGVSIGGLVALEAPGLAIAAAVGAGAGLVAAAAALWLRPDDQRARRLFRATVLLLPLLLLAHLVPGAAP